MSEIIYHLAIMDFICQQLLSDGKVFIEAKSSHYDFIYSDAVTFKDVIKHDYSQNQSIK